jgi:regulator of replication initiation timing
MVSSPETIPYPPLMTSSGPSSEEILTRLAALEEEVEQLREENQELCEENKRLRAKLRWYEGPHTPPSKKQSTEEGSS